MSEVISSQALQQLVAKIERLESEKKGLSEDITETYREAKSHGFDVKILREVIKLRKLDKAKLDENEELLEMYKTALGM